MIRLSTLGSLGLTRSDGVELRAVLAQPRRAALLIYLALARPPGFHRRDRLIALFWPDHDTERARAALNRAIYFLRREVGDGVIVSRGAEEVGLDSERCWCDAAAFEDAFDRRESTGALELYRGDLLPGFFASKADGFERWLEDERSRLRDRASHSAWHAVTEAEARAEFSLAAHWARRAVELAPFDEVGIRRLLSLLDRNGDRGGAVRFYQQFAGRLASELELVPAPETRALVDDIRSREHANGISTGVRAPEGLAPTPAESTSREDTPKEPGAPTVVRRRSRARVWAGAGGIAVMAGLGWAFGGPALQRVRTEPRSVFVGSFVNRTGDRALDDFGAIVADRITQSLSGTGLLEGVAPEGRAPRERPADDLTLPAGALHLTTAAHAGTIVSGEYHRESRRIIVQAWITDARRNRARWAVRPIAASVDSVGSVGDEIGRRVAGGVAALTMRHFASWFPVATSPPTFDAFQEFTEGVTLQSHGFDADAAPHLRRAAALDTTFLWAGMQLAYAYYNLFENGPADSIAAALNARRELLNPLQRHWLAWMLSITHEETPTGYRAMRSAVEMAPERFRYSLAKWAASLNRSRESIDVLERLGPENPHAGGPGAYWTLLTGCYHGLGDGERELRAAREARRGAMEPLDALSLEARALVSLDRIAEVRALLDSSLILRIEREPSALQVLVGISRKSSPAQFMVSVAQELRAHGHENAAQDALARALAWYRAERSDGPLSERRRFEIARVRYLSRDWAGADSAFRSLAAEDTSNYVYLGFVGTTAARRNDRATARRVLAKFDSLRSTLPRPRRIAGFWQAKINAILGDEARALTLMADVGGPQGDAGVHTDFDYERIWHGAKFREFIRPKG